jgi:predicted AAA+ superfamily ATPase
MQIQVCETLVNPLTRQREILALQSAMHEIGISEAIIVTKEETGQIPVKNGNIEVIPVWKFLLDAGLLQQ